MKRLANYCSFRTRLFNVSAVALLLGWAAAVARADSGGMVQALPAAPVLATGTAKVKGERCNVRSRPSTTAEVVAQLGKGELVDVLETKTVAESGKSREWLKIAMPAQARCFVSSKLITEGAANADAVNVRCGPGSNYHEVGKLAKGEKVEVVKTSGEWTQIKPSPHCVGWISSDLVEVLPPAPAPAPPKAEAPMAPAAVPVALAPAPIASGVTVVTTGPDETAAGVVKEGMLHTVKGPAGAPASYELLTPETDRLQWRICFVEAPDKNLSRYDGKNVRVLGVERWRKGDRWPVVVADRVDMIW